MAEDRTVDQLVKISKPIHFGAGDYICHEGQPGDEMYIVIQGGVSIYISTILDEAVEVAQVEAGDFFGEMALFDQLPRSASCVAREDTACIAISRRNLRQLIVSCPDIAEKLMMNLSSRMRDMNDRLYKTENPDTDLTYRPFSIPQGWQGHDLEEKKGAGYYLTPMSNVCPSCGKRIVVQQLRANMLTLERVENNQRHRHRELDTLWHYVWSCPECGYANYYMNFFGVRRVGHGEFLRMLTDENEALGRCGELSEFDRMAFRYYQAIHFNECTNGGDMPLLGKLWLYLCWLYTDAADARMAALCRDRALEYYRSAYLNARSLLPSEGARQQCAMIVAELSLEKRDLPQAKTFFYEVVKYPGATLTQQAYDRIYELREAGR